MYLRTYRYSGDGSGLNDDKLRPAEKECPKAPEGFAEVDVLPARVWHGGSEFTITQSGDDGEHRAHYPTNDQQARRFHLPCDISTDDKYAGPDHRAHHERRCVE